MNLINLRVLFKRKLTPIKRFQFQVNVDSGKKRENYFGKYETKPSYKGMRKNKLA